MLHLPDGAGQAGRWCARRRSGRDPTWGGGRRPSLSLRHGVSEYPLTRARVRLLGPCFKTGLVGSRHRRRPLAPAIRGPVPARAARRGQDALGAVRPGRQSHRGRGAPGSPTRASRAQRYLSPRPRGKRRSRSGAL